MSISNVLFQKIAIHRMQINVDESHESEASEALTMLPQKDLASSLIWSVLFLCGYELLCF